MKWNCFTYGHANKQSFSWILLSKLAINRRKHLISTFFIPSFFFFSLGACRIIFHKNNKENMKLTSMITWYNFLTSYLVTLPTTRKREKKAKWSWENPLEITSVSLQCPASYDEINNVQLWVLTATSDLLSSSNVPQTTTSVCVLCHLWESCCSTCEKHCHWFVT